MAGEKYRRKKEGLLLGVQKKLPYSGWGRHAEAAEKLGHAVNDLAKCGDVAAETAIAILWI